MTHYKAGIEIDGALIRSLTRRRLFLKRILAPPCDAAFEKLFLRHAHLDADSDFISVTIRLSHAPTPSRMAHAPELQPFLMR
jgi:hypothetical protein